MSSSNEQFKLVAQVSLNYTVLQNFNFFLQHEWICIFRNQYVQYNDKLWKKSWVTWRIFALRSIFGFLSNFWKFLGIGIIWVQYLSSIYLLDIKVKLCLQGIIIVHILSGSWDWLGFPFKSYGEKCEVLAVRKTPFSSFMPNFNVVNHHYCKSWSKISLAHVLESKMISNLMYSVFKIL